MQSPTKPTNNNPPMLSIVFNAMPLGPYANDA
jgi:hypothetical protein